AELMGAPGEVVAHALAVALLDVLLPLGAHGVDEARELVSGGRSVAPVGEKDDYVERAMRNIAPYLPTA
ncbi:MAG: hypothetical protein AB3X43_16875, partial [Sphaerotilus sp.]